MNKAIAALLLYIGLASAALAQNFTMPPPAGVFVGGYLVVANCGTPGATLTAGKPAFATMDTTGTLCTAGGGSGGTSYTVNYGSPNTTKGTPSGFNDASGNFQPLLGDVTNGQWVAVRSVASGAVASGAYAAGSFAAGALAAGAFATGAGVDGWDLTQGAKGDTAYAGSGSASVVALLKGIYALGAAPLPAQTGFGVNIGAAQQIDAGSNAALVDPCQSGTKVYTPVNVVTATNVIIAGVASKKKYICQILLYPGGTVNFAVYQATTGTSCATSAADIFGGHTTGTGFIATAGAGFAAGNGASSIAATNTVDTDICVTTSTTVQVSGVVVTVDR